eukprot:TRINITY_DN5979_c0_g1_i3.p1 TRINITY_DN5979_c0_g1~~TRINITY_DN5979_c0_g1_i3.p1  ORF type:complete len:229 (+),score=42.81 TRINITY_DN5979_c0_g1_i3:45-731(+)
MFPWFKAQQSAQNSLRTADLGLEPSEDAPEDDHEASSTAPSSAKPRSKWSYSAEEIAQWRAERRKHYPTAANAARKAEELRLKAKRNAVAVDENYRWSSSSKRMQNTSHNPLAGMLADYGSSDDSDKEEPARDTEQPDRPEEVSSKRPSASTMPPPSIASLSNKPDQRRKGRDSKTNRNRDKGSKKHNGKGKPASLLEMLLADQIRRERNVILQCIRHARQQNYFQNS